MNQKKFETHMHPIRDRQFVLLLERIDRKLRDHRNLSYTEKALMVRILSQMEKQLQTILRKITHPVHGAFSLKSLSSEEMLLLLLALNSMEDNPDFLSSEADNSQADSVRNLRNKIEHFRSLIEKGQFDQDDFNRLEKALSDYMKGKKDLTKSPSLSEEERIELESAASYALEVQDDMFKKLVLDQESLFASSEFLSMILEASWKNLLVIEMDELFDPRDLSSS